MSKEPCERSYHLTCKVKTFVKPVKDVLSNYNTLMVLLVPEKNDECMRFFRAWLPETPSESSELAAEISHPVSPFVRLAVRCGPDENNDGPYLFVMTTGMAQWLHANKKDQTVRVKTLSEGDEEMLDQAIDAEGSFDTISGHESF